MKKKIILFAAGLSVIGLGIWHYVKRQQELLSQFKWEVEALDIPTLTATSVVVNMKIKFISIADVEAKVNNVYLNVLVQGQPVGYVVNTEPFIVPAHGYSFINLSINFNPTLVLGGLVDIILGVIKNKNMTVSLDGYANIKSGWVSTTLPIEYSSEFKTPGSKK